MEGKRLRVLIKGAGDLATGIACRLAACGCEILMTERAVPTTVRRTVAFSRAVCEGAAVVENTRARLVKDMAGIHEAAAGGEIAVIVDENADITGSYRPDVIVDAIIAKKNLGTGIAQAPLVIGVGPGFTAGVDCHAVVETKRGHFLGRVMWEGSAIPNTGVPGMIGGYSLERLIKAQAAGIFHPLKAIGDMAEEGETVAESGGVPIKARMSGMIRGMLQDGVAVQENMKVGDIDARCVYENCFLISDKARAVGGGVLEALCSWQAKSRIAFILLASGGGLRYRKESGENKLFARLNGRSIYEYTLDTACAVEAETRIIVTQYGEIGCAAGRLGFEVIENNSPELGISHSIKLALKFLTERRDVSAAVFFVCDQPLLRAETVSNIVWAYRAGAGGIVSAAAGRDRLPETGGWRVCRSIDDVAHLGNPVLFDRRYFRELMELEGDCGGRQVLKRHPEDAAYVLAAENELADIDSVEEYGRIADILSWKEQNPASAGGGA